MKLRKGVIPTLQSAFVPHPSRRGGRSSTGATAASITAHTRSPTSSRVGESGSVIVNVGKFVLFEKNKNGRLYYKNNPVKVRSWEKVRLGRFLIVGPLLMGGRWNWDCVLAGTGNNTHGAFINELRVPVASSLIPFSTPIHASSWLIYKTFFILQTRLHLKTWLFFRLPCAIHVGKMHLSFPFLKSLMSQP